MDNSIIIYMRQDSGGLVDWVTAENHNFNLSKSQRGNLASALEQARGKSVTAIVPGRDILLAHTAVHARSKQQMTKAIPYSRAIGCFLSSIVHIH